MTGNGSRIAVMGAVFSRTEMGDDTRASISSTKCMGEVRAFVVIAVLLIDSCFQACSPQTWILKNLDKLLDWVLPLWPC